MLDKKDMTKAIRAWQYQTVDINVYHTCKLVLKRPWHLLLQNSSWMFRCLVQLKPNLPRELNCQILYSQPPAVKIYTNSHKADLPQYTNLALNVTFLLRCKSKDQQLKKHVKWLLGKNKQLKRSLLQFWIDQYDIFHS